MSDPKRFWKESIGVLPGATRRPARPATTTPPRHEPPATPGPDSPPPVPEPERATATAATGTRIDDMTVQALIGALPEGSAGFGDAVDRTMWRRPTPDDVARLARVAAAWRDMPLPELREAAACALGLRLRAERLAGSGPIVNLDADTWATRGAELLRIAAECERAAPRLGAFDGRPGAEAARAARELLPRPDDMRARSTLCSEIASLIETALLGGRTTTWRPIAAADALLGAIESGTLGADELDELEIFAACSAAHRDVEAGGREGLLRARRLLELIAATRQRDAAAGRPAERMDAAAIRRRAWLRLLAETRVRIDEELTRPHLTANAVPAPRGGHRVDDSVNERRDASLLAHLRRVRASRRAATRDEG